MSTTAWLTECGSVVLRCPLPPSKKNGQTMRRGRGGRMYPAKGDAVREAEGSIQVALTHALGHLLGKGSLFGSNDVGVEIEQLVETAELLVTFRDLGPAKSVNGRTGRNRDLQNLQDTVLDAAQSFVMDDDRQVVDLQMRRVVSPE